MLQRKNNVRRLPRPTAGLWIFAGAALISPGFWVRADGDGLTSLLRSGPGVANHPVNVVPPPGMRIPEGWPVDAGGAITCLTCHEHIPPAGSDRPQLREFSDDTAEIVEFCARCHTGDDVRSAAGMHWLAVDRAHINADEGSARATSGMDAESLRCMECHDGVSAGEFANSTPWDRGGASAGGRHEHPVGMAYPRSRPTGYDSSFRQAALLPKRMRIPEGKVSCVSCHDLYSQEESRLTVSIRGSELCLTCHVMD